MNANLIENVTLGRRAFFSAGRALRHPDWDEARNRAFFGKEAAAHGHDYVLDVFYSGTPAAEDGMIVNITDIKPVIAEVLGEIDGKFLNEEVEFFRANRPSAENIVRFIKERLPASLAGARLERLRLQETARLWVDWNEDGMLVTRSYEFAAAHRLHAPGLSEAENNRRYGKCNNPRGHGHNYGLAVTVAGEPDPATGSIIPLGELDQIVEEEVYAPFDHKHLNEDCPDFENLIPTSENLARVIFARLKPRIESGGRRLAKVGLHETQKNYFEVEG